MNPDLHTAGAPERVIHARGLRKTYGGTVALAGTDFTIEPGRIVGLIGPNGAGKTTALKAMLAWCPSRASSTYWAAIRAPAATS